MSQLLSTKKSKSVQLAVDIAPFVVIKILQISMVVPDRTREFLAADVNPALVAIDCEHSPVYVQTCLRLVPNMVLSVSCARQQGGSVIIRHLQAGRKPPNLLPPCPVATPMALRKAPQFELGVLVCIQPSTLHHGWPTQSLSLCLLSLSTPLQPVRCSYGTGLTRNSRERICRAWSWSSQA